MKRTNTIAHPDLIQVPIGVPEQIEELLKTHPVNHPNIKDLGVQKEYLLWFLHIVYMGTIEYKFEEAEQIKINNRTIKEYDFRGERFFKWLEINGFIISTGYSAGHSCKRYRLAKKFKFMGYRISTPHLIRKIYRLRSKRANKIKNDPLLGKLFEKMNGVKLKPGAREFAKSLNHGCLHSEMIKLDVIDSMSLEDGYWLTQGKNSNRVFSPLTNLKKELREQYLTIDGEDPAELDIQCCQPRLMLFMLKNGWLTDPKNFKSVSGNQPNGIFSYDIQSELPEFEKLFAPGADFYNFILEEYQKKLTENQKKIKFNRDLNRKGFKKIFMCWLFSEPKEMNKTISKVFKDHFPNILKLIEEFKTKGKKTLPALLQSLEAKIIFEEICPKLFGETFCFFTVHDSIIFPKSKELIVRSIWDKVLNQYGLI